MSRKSIYLVGSTGHPNYGDELIAAQWLRYLAEHEPDADVWLDCPSPGIALLLLGDLHPRVRFVDTFFRLCWSAPSDDPADVAGFGAEAIRNPGLEPRFAVGVELAQRADVFHVIGGGYVNRYWPRHLALLAAGTVLATRFDARSAITGAGFVPSAAPDGMLDELTRPYDVVDVRDTGSRQLLSADIVTNTGDDALLGLDPAALCDSRETRSVMVCAQSDLDASVDAIVETVLGTLRAWGVEGSKVGYVEAMPGADRRVFDLIEPELPEIRFYPFVEVWREGLPARRGQRWLTTRLHPHLVAAAAGAWGVAISLSDDYYGVTHDSLIEQGSRWASARAGEIATEMHGEAGFGVSLDTHVAAKGAVADAIYRG